MGKFIIYKLIIPSGSGWPATISLHVNRKSLALVLGYGVRGTPHARTGSIPSTFARGIPDKWHYLDCQETAKLIIHSLVVVIIIHYAQCILYQCGDLACYGQAIVGD